MLFVEISNLSSALGRSALSNVQYHSGKNVGNHLLSKVMIKQMISYHQRFIQATCANFDAYVAVLL